jgi:hypothetical protein
MRQNSAQRRGPRHGEQAPRRYSAAHRVSGVDDALADFLVRSILGRPVSVNHREFLGFVYYFAQLKSYAEIPVDRGLLLRSAARL